MLHPVIEMFAARARMLEAQDDPSSLDDAVAHLAAWIAQSRGRLSEDDLAVLNGVGAVLYREGLLRRGQ